MRAALAALLLLGCNQVFGIEDTLPPPPSDFDHDGVDDTHDDCPTLANADQADADHDGFGDACDPCAMGPQSGLDDDHDGVDDACDACLTDPNHEEDGDGALDGCDVCPGVGHPGQLDEDRDGVGDACDPATTAQHRIFFDAFDPPLDGWQFGFESWVAVDGNLVPQAEPLEAYRGPWNARARVDGAAWVVSTEVDLPQSPQLNDSIGVFAYRPDGTSTLDCAIVRGDSVWVLAGTGTLVTPGPTVRFTLFAQASSGGIDVFCTLDGGWPTLIASLSTQPWYPAITGVPGARFHWFDVAQ
jgi:hypothetical protein